MTACLAMLVLTGCTVMRVKMCWTADWPLISSMAVLVPIRFTVAGATTYWLVGLRTMF